MLYTQTRLIIKKVLSQIVGLKNGKVIILVSQYKKVKLYLSISPGSTGTASLADPDGITRGNEYIEVETVSLKKLIEINKINHINVMKIDVEEMESIVLDSLGSFIDYDMIDYLVIETTPHDPCYSKLTSRDYKAWFLGEPSAHISRHLAEKTSKDSNNFGDYLFVSKRKLASFKDRFAIRM